MNFTQELMAHYKAVRARLQSPTNAVADTGINLIRGRPTPKAPEEPPAPPTPPTIDWSLAAPEQKPKFTFSSTLEFVAKEFNLTTKDITTRTRRQEIAFPRQIAIWIAAKHRIRSLSSMGKFLHLDHTTIIHAKQKINSIMALDDTVRCRILAIEERLLANFDRTPVSAINEPHLESEKDGRSLSVTAVSAMD